MVVQQRQHWRDFPVDPFHLEKRKRVLLNWSGFKEPDREWRASNPDIEDNQTLPDYWDGAYDFRHRALESPLQCFFGDFNDTDNPAMVGVRLADRPRCWLNIRPMNVRPGSVAQVVNPRVLRWPEVWPNSALRFRAAANKLEKTIRLTAPGHPAVFRFTLRVPDGTSIEFGNNAARILDDQGVERLRLNAPWGKDSSTVNPDTIDGSNPIRVRMQEGNSQVINGRTYQVVRLVPHPDDLAGATYPVEIDPTATISGTANIEDANMRSNAVNNNYGGATTLLIGYLGYGHGLVRISPGSIPAGTITAFRLYVYSTRSDTIEAEAFFITDANDWVEGASSGAPATGTACWNQAKYTVQDWAGSPGCQTSVVDFDADPTPPTKTMPGAGWYEWILDPAWPPLWRDAVRVSNGIKIRATTSVGDFTYFCATEHATVPLYFEIDYDTGGAPVAAMLPRRMVN